MVVDYGTVNLQNSNIFMPDNNQRFTKSVNVNLFVYLRRQNFQGMPAGVSYFHAQFFNITHDV